MLAEVSVPYVDTCASSLRWSLAEPRLPHLARQCVIAGDVEIEALVIGQSHQVVVHRSSSTVIETVACGVDTGDVLPTAASLTVGGDRYDFRSRVRHLNPEAFRVAVDELVASARSGSDALVARFPGGDDAVTAISVDSCASTIRWRTWHAYPQRRELVETLTEITPA